MPGRVRLNYLRAFEAAARHLSFSAAADELHLTQAAISQQIAKLERSFNTSLFVRYNRALGLTEHGKAYHLVVSEVLDRLDSATTQLFPRIGSYSVSVRCTPSVASNWLAPQLGDFLHAHPSIEVRIRTLDLHSDRYRPARHDLEICRGSENAAGGDTRLLWTAEILPLCSPHYLQRHGPFAAPEDVARLDLIDIIGYNNNWHRWLRRFAPASPRRAPTVTVDGLNIAVEAACRGEGIILGRRPLVDAFIRDGRLVRALACEASLHSPYYLKVDPTAPAGGAVRLLADWISARGQGAGPAP